MLNVRTGPRASMSDGIKLPIAAQQQMSPTSPQQKSVQRATKVCLAPMCPRCSDPDLRGTVALKFHTIGFQQVCNHSRGDRFKVSLKAMLCIRLPAPTAARSFGVSVLGNVTPSTFALRTKLRSSANHSVPTAFMLTNTGIDKLTSQSACPWRTADFSGAGTASSRSTITAPAPLWAALAIRSGRVAGTNNGAISGRNSTIWPLHPWSWIHWRYELKDQCCHQCASRLAASLEHLLRVPPL